MKEDWIYGFCGFHVKLFHKIDRNFCVECYSKYEIGFGLMKPKKGVDYRCWNMPLLYRIINYLSIQIETRN